ncbi:molybdopterin-dependent oxidoreductase [Desulfitobacterium sp. THU1]|uniref:molybdopterin-containing oxidoreductase family protein n=1 Tax=Desulfitobacterium sp. THU1 TaxID=3138072 RepID=UPI00311F9FF8
MTNENKTKTKTPGFSRRTFIKGTGAVAATAAVGGIGFSAGMPDVVEGAPVDLSNAKTFTSSCAMECLHHNLKGYVVDGKLVKVETGDDQTKACLRGISRTQWVNNPDRPKMPMLRTGEKGEGKWKEISWDEATDLIVTKIKETQSELGNQGITYKGGSGNFGALTNGIAGAFFNYIGGSTPIVGSLCCQVVTTTMPPMLGTRYEDTRDTIQDSKYIIVWGTNPAVTMQSYFSKYQDAMSKGAKMVTIDPRLSETAAKSDEWITILPGTDTALGLGMLKIIIEEKLYDQEFLLKHTGVPFLVDKATGNQVKAEDNDTSYMVYDQISKSIIPHDQEGISPALSLAGTPIAEQYNTVFELIYNEAKIWTPEKVQEETDVPAGTVVRLAHEYATAKPAMIVQNMGGFQRTEYGSYAVGVQFYLAAFTGNFGKAGGGVCDAGGVGTTIKVNAAIPSPKPQGEFGKILSPKLGESILADTPNKIGFMWVMTTSLMTQFPNTGAVKEALKKIPFVVVVDSLMTSTALYADLVLPCTTIFEDTNLLANNRHHYVQLMEKAVEPPGEAKSDLEIFTMLAKKLGFGEAFDKDPEELIRVCLEGTGITLEQLKEGPVCPMPQPYIPYPNGKFRTPTEKAELFMPMWKEKGFNPVVTYIRPNEFINGDQALAEKYPLMAVQRKTNRTIHSTFGNLPWICESTRSKAQVLIHPDDAAARGIKSGDKVVAYNDRGEHHCLANVQAHIKKGVVALENGWWEQQGGSSSYVTNDFVEPLGGGHSCNNTLVQIRKEA